MSERVFKTAWFAKVAKKARISDKALSKAIGQVALGQADDLGGGVFKKRLNDNMHRSIVLAKAGEFWCSPISSQEGSGKHRRRRASGVPETRGPLPPQEER